MSSRDDSTSEVGPLERFRDRRTAIREEMGGAAKIARLHASGELTAREWIDLLVDDGSFEEMGTFAVSQNPDDREATPGDGKITGTGLVDGRYIAIAADDVTVKRATSAHVGDRRVDRAYETALHGGLPFVVVGATGGARIPDIMSAEGYTSLPPGPLFARRRRRIPMVTAIVGDSFGGSSFMAGLSDFVVQMRGTCFSLTSPRVVEEAIGQEITGEELGGVAVHENLTGQIDAVADTPDEAVRLIREFLGYLPPNSWTAPDRSPAPPLLPDEEFGRIVPAEMRRGYDMRRVLSRVFDDERFLEMRPNFGKGLLVGYARLNGFAVGFAASQPLQNAGALDPAACDKLVALLCQCDAYDLPVVFLQDVPGLLVGTEVEHGRAVGKGMMLLQALSLCGSPRASIVLRKGFGFGHNALSGAQTDADLLCAWPGAQIGFMDPLVGANVVYSAELAELEGDARRSRHLELAEHVARDSAAYGAAGAMHVDEIIDPVDTRVVLGRWLERVANRRTRSADERLLSTWPSHW